MCLVSCSKLDTRAAACSRLTQVSLSQEGRGSPAQFPCGWRACSPAPPEWGGRPQPHVVPAPRSGGQRVLAGLLPPPQHHPRPPHRPRGAGQLCAGTGTLAWKPYVDSCVPEPAASPRQHPLTPAFDPQKEKRKREADRDDKQAGPPSGSPILSISAEASTAR